jgi:RimJ/RimL family protein N-acetyltransferase
MEHSMNDAESILGRRIDQSIWPLPEHKEIRGDTVVLEPLSQKHLAALWACASRHPESFDHVKYGPFNSEADLATLLEDLSHRAGQPFWAAVPKGGTASGWLSICDICQYDGSIEIGSIWYSPTLQGTRQGREAVFMLMCQCMDHLGYERLVWRCHARNDQSFRAAENMGFTHEGNWRNASVVDGWQRDVAWFSILKNEWPNCRAALAQWLAARNFDSEGAQVENLRDLRSKLDTQ